MRMRRLLVSFAALGLCALMLIPGGAGAQDEGPVTLTIGLTQDIDSPNVTAGYLVSSFEVWNLMYDTLTTKAASDFSVQPALAESWEVSDDGQTVTYTLREGLQWSDGEPLTADDVAYTINRSRDEEWINHSSTVANITATAVDDRTVELVSSVPDPKLPVMDVYIVPQHVYESISADDIVSYDGLDGVGSGPYTLESWSPGESWVMVRNENYHGWEEGAEGLIDRIVFRLFSNGDAMAAALQQGELDAAHSVPAESFQRLDEDPNIVAVVGQQGGFSELGMNAGAGGIGDGHPALLDKTVRQAINHAIDRDLLLERVALGLGSPGGVISPSADPSWKPEIPADQLLGFDPAKANQMLDDAGYADTDGDGVREMPDGSRPLEFRYAQRSESTAEPALSEFVTGWLEDIGIATTIVVFDDSQLTDAVSAGEFDLFSWGWTPFVDPDPMLSYFTCSQVSYNADDYGYNDANWCNEEYDTLYQRQNVELDPDTRRDIVGEMLLLLYEEAPYVVYFDDADLQAYRTDRFEGWIRQPEGTGPVIFSNSSPSYVNLRQVGFGTGVGSTADGTGTASDDGGTNVPLLAGIGMGIAILLGGGGLWLRQRSTADDRE